MFRFLCKCKKPFQSNEDSTSLLCFLLYPSLIRHISSNPTNHNSLTISYLMNSCGLSEEKAISAAKKLHFETSARPDSVLTLLRNYGFTETHISELVSKRPVVLLSDLNKTLEPKMKFFHSIGFSGPDFAKIASRDPTVLVRSLEKQIIPRVDFLKSYVHTDENVVTMIKRSTWVLHLDPRKEMSHNVAVLRDVGVPESNISMLLINQPRALLQTADRFNEVVNEIKEMGFNPLKAAFVSAIHGLTSMSKATWEAKFEVYRKWGWSEDEIRTAFMKDPFCMMTSAKKISQVMDFLVNTMGYDPSEIAKRPAIFKYSMEKRIIPRYSVIQVLISKGLFQKEIRVTTMFTMVEPRFLKKFVTKYEKILPELWLTYQGKKNGVKLPIKSEGGELKML